MRFTAIALVLATRVAAQELEPRSYSPSPIGTSFFVSAYSYSSGGILFDPTVPITDGHAQLNALSAGYGHVFAIGRAQALFTAALPFFWGHFRGKLGGSPTDTAVDRTGVGDARLKLSTNFIGSPALTPAEFARGPLHRFVMGASVAIVVPTGQYYSNKLVNIGANRWAFKPEIGASYNWNAKIFVDFYAGCWFFAKNPNYYTGDNALTQDPLASFQLHASYVFMPRFYVSLTSTWYIGGSTHLNDGPASERTDNSRLGLLVSYGLTRTQSLKLSYSDGATVRVGSSYQTVALAYQLVWF